MCFGRLFPTREARPDVLLGALRRQWDGPRTAANEKITFSTVFYPFPFQEYWLRAALAAHDADRFTLHDLRLGIDACARSVAQSIANDLGKMAHELVVIVELVALNADDRTVVCNAD